MICGGLLIAAPLAIVLSRGDPQAGGARVPGGVFTGGPDGGTGGTGGGGTGGTGGTGASLATTASQTPAPAGSAPVAVDPASEVAGALPAGSGTGLATGGGASGGAGTVGQPGTAAGAPAPAGQQPAQHQPAQQQPAGQQQSAPQQPAPQQPAPSHDPTGAPCPCQIVNGVLTSVTRLVPTEPLPKLPVSPLG